MNPVIPFEPVRSNTVPEGEQWIAQVKFDGVRVLTYYDGTDVRLFNRRLNERTRHYPELTPIRSFCSANSVILDGEVVAFEGGRPSFYQVMKRDGRTHFEDMRWLQDRVPIAYMVFDILHLNGESTTSLPLTERQALLSEIMLQNETVHLVESFVDAAGLFDAVALQGLEGVVIKDCTSTYLIHGKDARWRKRKFFRDITAVVGGVTYRNGVVNSLLLGLYDEQQSLRYIGKAGAGRLSAADWHQLTSTIQPILQPSSPFANQPSVSNAVWVGPLLTVKVQFLEWSHTLSLRQPTIQSFVAVDPATCRIE